MNCRKYKKKCYSHWITWITKDINDNHTLKISINLEKHILIILFFDVVDTSSELVSLILNGGNSVGDVADVFSDPKNCDYRYSYTCWLNILHDS